MDSGALLGIAVVATDTVNGSWWYSINGGTNWSTLGAVAVNDARLLAADANTRLYFEPNPDYSGTLAAAITFRAWDQTSGVNGGLADTTTSGGATAFSTSTDAASLVVNPVNDAPLLVLGGGEATPLTYTENDPATTITATITVGDVDNTHFAGATIQLTGNYQNGQDVLAFSDTANITGSWNPTNGTLTLSGSDTLANYQAALRSVTYQNTSDNPSGLTRTVGFAANDGTVNSNTVTRNIVVTPVNDAPSAVNDPSFSTQVLANQPVAYWRLGEPSGSIAVNLGSSGINGTYAGPTLGAAGAFPVTPTRQSTSTA